MEGAQRSQSPRRQRSCPRSFAERRCRCKGDRSALLRFMRGHGMLEPQVRAAAGAARPQAAAAWAPAEGGRHRLHRAGLHTRGVPARDARAGPLVLDRSRLQAASPRGHDLDRGQDRDGPGVHDLLLPARVDRPRVRDRGPGDDDRLRHGMVEVDRPIRLQGIYKRDVRVGHNVWIGYGACILRGVTVGDNAVIGTNAVVTRDVPAKPWSGGVPAQLIRMREKPQPDALHLSTSRAALCAAPPSGASASRGGCGPAMRCSCAATSPAGRAGRRRLPSPRSRSPAGPRTPAPAWPAWPAAPRAARPG